MIVKDQNKIGDIFKNIIIVIIYLIKLDNFLLNNFYMIIFKKFSLFRKIK